MIGSRWVAPYLAAWSLVLCAGTLSELAEPIARASGIALLAILSAHAVGRRWRAGGWKGVWPAALLLTVGAAGTFLETGTCVLSAAAWIAGVLGLERSEGGRSAVGRFVVAAAIGAILSLVPGLWNVVDRAALGLTSGLFSWAGGGGLGASASGVWTFLLVVPLLVPVGTSSLLRRLAPAGSAAILLLVHGAVASQLGPASAARLAAELAYVALLLGTCVAAVVAPDPPIAKRDRRRRWRAWAGLAGVLGLACVVTGLPGWFAGRAPDAPRTVLFVDHELLGSWGTPADAALGAAFSGATFGQFPHVAAASGHRVTAGETIDADALRGVDLVVIINPGAPFGEDERQTLYRFVERGGAVLVLGDHTNIGGIMDAVNGLTAPLGLALAFDSAVSLDPGWIQTLRVLPPFDGLFRTVEIPVSIGASVTTALRPDVVPLLVGRRAFSDPGDAANVERAFLGNLALDRGEDYGDVVLAAVRHLGRGKVVLFGDTSPFQSSAVAESHRFTDALIRWLTDGTGSWQLPTAGLLAIVLVAAVAILVASSSGPIAGAVALAVAAGILLGQAVAAPLASAGATDGRLAVIDAGHGNLIQWEPLDDRGVEGLTVNLAREGFVPVVRHERVLDPMPSTDSVIVAVAPTRTYTAREARTVLDWVASGGMLLIATGWPQSTALAPFLDPLGISIAPIPLGTVLPQVDSLDVQPQLPSAWPVVTSPEWTVLGRVEWDGATYAVVAARAVGSGAIVVVGDNGAFQNDNLEGKDFAFVENVAFLARLLAHPRGGDDPS